MCHFGPDLTCFRPKNEKIGIFTFPRIHPGETPKSQKTCFLRLFFDVLLKLGSGPNQTPVRRNLGRNGHLARVKIQYRDFGNSAPGGRGEGNGPFAGFERIGAEIFSPFVTFSFVDVPSSVSTVSDVGVDRATDHRAKLRCLHSR